MEKATCVKISRKTHQKLLEHVFAKKKKLHGEIKRFVEDAINQKIQQEQEKAEKEELLVIP